MRGEKPPARVFVYDEPNIKNIRRTKMTNTLTVDQIEQLAVQLPLQEQIRILARLTQGLSECLSAELDSETRERKEYAQRVEAFLKMSDERAAETISAGDSAEDIRQLRDERVSRL